MHRAAVVVVFGVCLAAPAAAAKRGASGLGGRADMGGVLRQGNGTSFSQVFRASSSSNNTVG